jgi:hypothetical protein
MPTIKVFGRCKIAIYADDHNPPHFHLRVRDWTAKFAIKGCRHLAGAYPAGAAAEVLRWAREHERDLIAIWMELNERES